MLPVVFKTLLFRDGDDTLEVGFINYFESCPFAYCDSSKLWVRDSRRLN